MRSATVVPIGLASPPQQAWRQIVATVAGWAQQQRLDLRDVVLLLPFVQLLDPARRAFAEQGGWLPRIETTQTLRRAIGPLPATPAGAMTGDRIADALLMAQLLRAAAGLADWERRDPRAFAQVVDQAVDAAHRLAQAAACRAPGQRDAFWDEARAQLGPAHGAADLDGAVARVALEWARLAPPPPTDALFDLAVAGWAVVRAGGADLLAEAIAARHPAPALLLDTDAAGSAGADPAATEGGGPGSAPRDGRATEPGGAWHAVAVETAAPRLVEADGLEGEARATVLEVLQALRGGHVPVALIALDRVLVRRVRALLERCNVALADETGWALSTTRAAARLMAMLRAAAAGATADDRLEWLKALPPDRVPADAVQRLETAWRAGRDVDARRDPGAADALAFATASLVPLSPDGGPRRRPLATWLRALEGALGASALGEALAQDPAGRQALAALGVGPQAPAGLARAAALGAEIVDLDGFGGWVDRVLESATFVPAALGQAEVVLTPLARAVMRPFGAAVLAGADESRLGVAEPARGLIGPAAMAALGLDGAAERLRRDRAAFAQLLRLGTVAVVRRRADGDEPVGPSPFVAALSLARRHAGLPPLASAPSNGPLRRVDPSPVHRPAPVPGAVLPAELSATAVERLRQCPYRFFARSVLGLGEADELARELDQRDYGNWLHAALHRFHRERTAAASTVDDDARALRQAAAQAAAEAGLDPAALLPFRAAFERLLPAYLAWLHGRDVAGARWQDGETRRERSADALGGVRLAGRIDRIDRGADGAAELIDYKTGRPEKFKVLVRRNRYEDTQLAFYALLVGADEADAAKVRAAYLPLDSGEAIATIEHPEVADSARALLAGLAHDLARLRAGAGLPALGESPVCDHCEARGLCRRDHWHGPPEAAG